MDTQDEKPKPTVLEANPLEGAVDEARAAVPQPDPDSPSVPDPTPEPFQLRRYKSHLVVHAAKILAVVGLEHGARLTFVGGAMLVSDEWVSRLFLGTDEDLGYYVLYEPDGYECWSPSAAFEAGYDLIED